jgi:hypothetical protein
MVVIARQVDGFPAAMKTTGLEGVTDRLTPAMAGKQPALNDG